MREKGRVFVLIFKLCAAVFLCLSIQKSWAGWELYQGSLAFKDKKFVAASGALSNALKQDSANPALLDLWVRNAWHLGVESKDKAGFETAAIFSEQLNQQMPYFGRAWLYRALSRIYLKRLSGEKNNPEDWEEIKGWIEKAYKAEQGSPWMAFMTAKWLLSETAFLSPEEKQQALDRMKKSLSLHYTNQVSPYLEPALSFLWKQFSDFDVLKYVTPSNVFSYQRLLGLMEQKNLWEGRDEIWTAISKWSEPAYVQQCEKAESFLKRGQYEYALFEFHVATWMNNSFVRAKAGILASQKNLDGLEENTAFELKQILEDEEEDLSALLDFLGPVAALTEDPYLQGLFYFRKGDFKSALLRLEKAEDELKHKLQLRYLAISYRRLGEKEKAVNLLKKTLDGKDPDSRDLLLFKKWNTPYRHLLAQKIKSLLTQGHPRTAWWGEEFENPVLLKRKGNVGVPVQLKPGPGTLYIQMRAFPDPAGVYPYIRVRLWDQDRPYLIAESYRKHRTWEKAAFPIKTTGGKRWLQVELFNGAEPSSVQRGPILELGAMEIQYGPQA